MSNNKLIQKGHKFKSINPIMYKTESGVQEGLIEGEVIEVKKNKVYLKGLNFDFNIDIRVYIVCNAFSNSLN